MNNYKTEWHTMLKNAGYNIDPDKYIDCMRSFGTWGTDEQILLSDYEETVNWIRYKRLTEILNEKQEL